MALNSKEKGEWGEARVVTELLAHGITVLKPFGEAKDIDLVVRYQGGPWMSVQVKCGALEGNGVKADLRRNNAQVIGGVRRNNNRRGHYAEDAYDVLAVVNWSTDRVWFFLKAALSNRRSLGFPLDQPSGVEVFLHSRKV